MLSLVFVLYALFGLSFTLGKLTLLYAPPFFIIGARMIVGGLGLISFIIARHRFTCHPIKEDYPLYAQLILFGVYLPYCARSWALQYVPTTKAALIFNLAPFFAALFAYFIHKERLTIMKVIGLIIGFVGMIPLLSTSSAAEDAWFNAGIFSLPELAMVGAVMCLSYNLIIMQTLVRHRNCPPYLANAIAMMMGGLLAFATSAILETPWHIVTPLTFAALLGVQILISNMICANLQAHLLKHYSTTFMSFASFLSPLFTAVYGWLLLGETISWHFFASFVIVLSGLAIYYFDDWKKTRLKATGDFIA